MFARLLRFSQFIRLSHTVFALPFALGAMVVAAKENDGWPGWRLFLLIMVCMVTARTAAMTFNRIIDWEIDQRNPRTAGRHLLLAKKEAIFFCFLSSLLFLGAASLINHLTMILAPCALAILFFYSWTKRFTPLAQFFLGTALAISPIGASIAVTGKFSLAPCLLALGVICWVAGFDTIYAMQDIEVDRREGLHSMVVLLGVDKALKLAQLLHLFLFFFLLLFGVTIKAFLGYYIILLGIPFFLWKEHQIAGKRDLKLINKAFFEANAWVGLLFFIACLGTALHPLF